MSDAVLTIIVGGIVTALPIVLTQWFAYLAQARNQREARAEAALAAAAALAKIEEVHKATNGLTEKLSAAKLIEGRAEGRAEAGVQAERDAALKAQGALQAQHPIVAKNGDHLTPATVDDKSKISISGELTKGTVNVDKEGEPPKQP